MSESAPIDAYVGQRIREIRTLRKISQDKLATALGITFQQIQKYERGVNRVGAGRLFEISQFFEVPVSYFFEELPGEPDRDAGLNEGQDPFVTAGPGKSQELPVDAVSASELVELVATFSRIEDKNVRFQLVQLLRSLAKAPGESNS